MAKEGLQELSLAQWLPVLLAPVKLYKCIICIILIIWKRSMLLKINLTSTGLQSEQHYSEVSDSDQFRLTLLGMQYN